MRPHAQQCCDAHRMKLFVHCDWIGPSNRVEIQLALFRHVQEVHHQHIERQVAVTISLRNCHELVLGGIDRLALDVAICGLRQHGRDAGELAIAFVDLVAVIARDHEKGNTVSHFG